MVINNYTIGPLIKAKEKYRGVFEIQKSGDKTSSGEIGLDIRTHASPKVGQDQVSGGVSVLCWHAEPVAYVLWKPCIIRFKVKFGNRVQIKRIYFLYKRMLAPTMCTQFFIKITLETDLLFSPMGNRGIKLRMCPLYPHACRKKRLK